MTRETVPSPCTQVCRLHPATGWCEGCLRTLDEIAAWSRLDDDARRAVWAVLPVRRNALVTQPTRTQERP